MGSDPQSYLQYLHDHCNCAAAELRPILEKKIKELEAKIDAGERIGDAVLSAEESKNDQLNVKVLEYSNFIKWRDEHLKYIDILLRTEQFRTVNGVITYGELLPLLESMFKKMHEMEGVIVDNCTKEKCNHDQECSASCFVPKSSEVIERNGCKKPGDCELIQRLNESLRQEFEQLHESRVESARLEAILARFNICPICGSEILLPKYHEKCKTKVK